MIHIVFISDNFRLYDNPFLTDLFEQVSRGDSLIFCSISPKKNDGLYALDFKIGCFAHFIDSFKNDYIRGYVYQGTKKVFLAEVKEYLGDDNVSFYENNQRLFLFPIDTVSPMKVFTPFFKKMTAFEKVPSCIAKISQAKINLITKSISLKLNNLKEVNAFSLVNYGHFSVGEKETQKAWDHFKKNQMEKYPEKRDFIDECFTSRLSAAINRGVISVRQLWHESIAECGIAMAQKFLSELGWREFSYHVAHYNPEIETKNLQNKMTHKYLDNDDLLNRWKEGKTGFAIVDAAMNQLNQEGWMPNRARMIVASFLIKNLHCDWRLGAQYFMEKLVDGDNIINAFNWQWVAGIGYDSAPYFRIFNPELQAKKFDPRGRYVETWDAYKGEKIIDFKESRRIFLEEVVSK